MTGMMGRDHAGLQDYFDEMRQHHPEFWRRFGRRPDFAGKTVLDIGSGVGAMSVEMAEEGATVLGIELHEERVAFSTAHVSARFPEIADRCTFATSDLSALDMPNRFDYAVSKDTFEHVADVEEMLRFIRTALKPGAELWAGFSPAWYSPNGDHGLAGGRMPWIHLLLPRQRVYERMSVKTGREIRSLADVDLNGMSPAEFRRHIAAAGLEVVQISYNSGDKLSLRAMKAARRVPGFERFFTAGIYAILRRPG